MHTSKQEKGTPFEGSLDGTSPYRPLLGAPHPTPDTNVSKLSPECCRCWQTMTGKIENNTKVSNRWVQTCLEIIETCKIGADSSCKHVNYWSTATIFVYNPIDVTSCKVVILYLDWELQYMVKKKVREEPRENFSGHCPISLACRLVWSRVHSDRISTWINWYL